MEVLTDKDLKDPVLEKVARLFALQCIKDDLGFFLSEGMLSRVQAKELDTEISKLCADLCPFISYLLEGFNIPEHLIHAPIARDYISYNLLDKDNRGEVMKVATTSKRRIHNRGESVSLPL
jgi:acyl-CoA oxidase